MANEYVVTKNAIEVMGSFTSKVNVTANKIEVLVSLAEAPQPATRRRQMVSCQ